MQLGLDWSVGVSGQWSSPANSEHINSLEVRAALSGLRYAVRAFGTAVIGSRVLLCTDSLVALSVLSKGRSSSHAILRRVRAVAALVLATRMRPIYRYISTERNPADKPSRALCAPGSRIDSASH